MEKQKPSYDMLVSRVKQLYPKSNNISFDVMGLCGETGEVANKAKKIEYYPDTWNKPEPDCILDELGDVLFHVVAVAHHYGYTLADIIEDSTNKQTKRHLQ